jgi:energy-coupling factor transport system ATP-binding protein
MGNAIVIKNIDFGYDKKGKLLFEDLSLEIEEGSFTTVVGPNGSGKSTLGKMIVGLVEVNGFIKVCNKFVNSKNINQIRKQVGIVFDNPNNQFICDTVKEDIEFALQNYGYKDSVIKKKEQAIVELFEIEDILDCSPEELSGGQKQLVALAIAFAHDPKIIILDEALEMLDNLTKTKVLKIIKKINEKGVTIINITHNSEDILIGSHVIIINDGKIILNDKVKKSFETLKTYIDNRVSLPFIVDLSSKLKYYKVIDKLYLDNKRLVDDLWK